jgi:hypothetical protein
MHAWSQYQLGNGEAWPSKRRINYTTILQLDSFCRREGKWCEVSYVQLFFVLREKPELRRKCYVNTALLVALQTLAPRKDFKEKYEKEEAEASPLAT